MVRDQRSSDSRGQALAAARARWARYEAQREAILREPDDFSPEADARIEASLRAQGVTFGPMPLSRREREYFRPARRPRPVQRARRPICVARPHPRRRREASTRSCARSGSSGDDPGGDDPPPHHVVPTAGVGPVGARLANRYATPTERLAALCAAPEPLWDRWWTDLAELLREREERAA